MHQRRRYEMDNLEGELRKLKPPTFDGEIKRGNDAKTQLVGIKKIFLVT